MKIEVCCDDFDLDTKKFKVVENKRVRFYIGTELHIYMDYAIVRGKKIFPFERYLSDRGYLQDRNSGEKIYPNDLVNSALAYLEKCDNRRKLPTFEGLCLSIGTTDRVFKRKIKELQGSDDKLQIELLRAMEYVECLFREMISDTMLNSGDKQIVDSISKYTEMLQKFEEKNASSGSGVNINTNINLGDIYDAIKGSEKQNVIEVEQNGQPDA